jgi:hypothetical protein
MSRKAKNSKLADRDFVLLVAVVLVLIAIVLVCCKQSVPAALLVVFVMALLALSIEKPQEYEVADVEAAPAVRAQTSPQTFKARPATTMGYACPPNIPAVPNAVNHVPLEGQGLPPALTLQNQPFHSSSNLQSVVPVESVTVTNVPVVQNDPPQAPKVCSVNSRYNEFNPPDMNSQQSNTYEDLYVLPTDVSRPKGQQIAQVQAKTMSKCIKKEIGAFPAPDRMKGGDVFMGDEADMMVQLELERLKGQASTNSLVVPPEGSSVLNAALEVSPPEFVEYNYVKPLPDFNKEMKQKIRNEGLYGIHGDLNCLNMRRSATADTGFVQPINARQEWLRYLAYDMPNYKNQWQTARANTVNSDTRYFK